jgi:PBP superfamily domain
MVIDFMKCPGLIWILLTIIQVACAPSLTATTPIPITVQYSFAAQPWLANLDNCAGEDIVETNLRAAAFQDLQSADMVMRYGQSDNLKSPAFQIGTDDLLVIINPNNPVNKLTIEQVSGLFSGRIQTWKLMNGTDAPVQVWVFPHGEDVQQIFEQSVLGGGSVTSSARLANTPDEMSQAISRDVNAIGIITRHWKTGNTLEVFTAASNLPVLAITMNPPQGTLARIIACLQK